MAPNAAETSPLAEFLRVFQYVITSLVVAVWALTAAVYPNQPLALLLGLVSFVLLGYAVLVMIARPEATVEPSGDD